MQNILYCFDENYNIQATVSMFSLLKQTNEKINFHIIHKNPKSFESLLATIEKNQILMIALFMSSKIRITIFQILKILMFQKLLTTECLYLNT